MATCRRDNVLLYMFSLQVNRLINLGVLVIIVIFIFFFFSSRRRHTRLQGDWSSDVCSSDLMASLLNFVEIVPHPFFQVHVVIQRFDWRFGRQVFLFAKTDRLRRVYDRARSEERRVGKECRSRWSPDHLKKKK